MEDWGSVERQQGVPEEGSTLWRAVRAAERQFADDQSALMLDWHNPGGSDRRHRSAPRS
jgi:hypothetical protein